MRECTSIVFHRGDVTTTLKVMGVKGLLSLMQLSTGSWKAVTLSNGAVVIDGNAMAIHAFCTAFASDRDGVDDFAWRLAGSYQPFARTLRRFLTSLHEANVKITVIFDGYGRVACSTPLCHHVCESRAV